MKFGMAPPKPSPVKNRMTNSVFGPMASAVNKEQSPNNNSVAISTRFRPTKSAIRPPMPAPRNSPMVAELNISVKAPG